MNPGNPAVYQDSILTDIQKMVQEVYLFVAAGGSTLVEMTPLNFGRDVTAYRELSQATGLQVICATGFHKQEFIPDWFHAKSNREVIELLIGEITLGVTAAG